MAHSKSILASTKNYKITYYMNKDNDSGKCIITFGEVDSHLDEEGFGSRLVMDEGMDHIYVAQRRRTQYQFLSASKFRSIISDVISEKEVYTYGSSLGGYCAIYYGGAINANVLAMSPRIPAHPVIHKLMGERFSNKGFRHKELEDSSKTNKRVCGFYDEKNYVDNYFVSFFLKVAYPDAEYYHVENAGHYAARALLLSKELKRVALDFFNDKRIHYTVEPEKILEWHFKAANRRIKKGKLTQSQENLEVLLVSDQGHTEAVRKIVETYKKKLTPSKVDMGRSGKPSVYPVISDEMASRVDEAVSLSFSGDLTSTLEEAINTYNPETRRYECDGIFSFIEKHLKSADLTMGIFEKKEEDASNPKLSKSFAHTLKGSGFDFVVPVPTHKVREEGSRSKRIMEVLEDAELSQSGHGQQNAGKASIFEMNGLKVAILTYAIQSNNLLSNDENSHPTSLLAPFNDKNFGKMKKKIQEDFNEVKSNKPDCIVVISHIERKLLRASDQTEAVWYDTLVDAGADVIFNNHTQTIKPYEWRKKPDGNSNVLIIRSCGSLISSSTKKEVEASILTEVHLDKQTGKPFALSCIPLWTHSYIGDVHKPLPIHDIVVDKDTKLKTSAFEFRYIKEMNESITETMLGEKLSIDQVQEKYFLYANQTSLHPKGYARNRVAPLEISRGMVNKEIYQILSTAESACIVGDAITEGTYNVGDTDGSNR